MKIFAWFKDNILFVLTLFLLAFIPLYPKLPLIGVTHTWVYIRLEDFLIAAALIVLAVQFFRKKANIITPLSFPIFLFWGVGALSTIYAVIFIFPHLLDVFPKLAFLNYLRRIEYISLFFLAYSAIKQKKDVYPIVITLMLTVLAVVFYGIGQRLWGFPAFLTMNEEFAKGIPLRLSEAARIPSTFAGHYDLAAYLVMMIPILGSMFFGLKKWYMKILMALSAFAGLILLLMTASRTSFFVYLLTISFMLILQKKKWVIIPVCIISIITLQSFQGIAMRFGSTISSADVVYDARTGKAVGIAQQVQSGGEKKIVIQDTQSTGENLPQGSSYINLPTTEQTTTATNVTFKRSTLKDGTQSTEIRNLEGDFIVRKSLSIDISATTRFQGEWPRAIDAFKRNILLGSGYSSISLATDGNYVRILGEVGLLGLFSFILIFIFIFIYAAKILPDVDSKVVKSFVYGLLAAIVGLALNAILIDVFEASKVAYVLWLLVGITIGILHLYQKEKINWIYEVKRVLFSIPAISLYIGSATVMLFWMCVNNFFVGDDFTWLHWIASAPQAVGDQSIAISKQIPQVILRFFTDSQGFFYRPGTKTYFYFLYAVGQFSPFIYHLFSILFHAFVTILLFIFASRILKSRLFGAICATLFLVLSIHFEVVFWIASTGHLITSFFFLLSLLFYIFWKEKSHWIFLVISLLCGIIAPLFHEFGAFVALLIIGYDLVEYGVRFSSLREKWYYLLYLLEIPLYYWMRTSAQSQWFQGDYSYNLARLPYNIFGNLFGYIGLSLIGTKATSFIDQLRVFSKGQLGLSAVVVVLIVVGVGGAVWLCLKKLSREDNKVIGLSLVFYIIPLLPFLGLGNTTPRYAYLASFGLLLFITFLFQKIFNVLYDKQRILSYLILLLLTPFIYFHILELQRINNDWAIAGNTANKMMVKIGLNYKSAKTDLLPKNPVFYFANVPIRHGDAWVFPVGLPDAIWFVFQKEHVTVKQYQTVEEAILTAKTAPGKIFEFTSQGDIEEIIDY